MLDSSLWTSRLTEKDSIDRSAKRRMAVGMSVTARSVDAIPC